MLNRRRVNGTYDSKEMRIRDRDRKMMNDPGDIRRENELLISNRISIDIDKKENEERGKVYKEVL